MQNSINFWAELKTNNFIPSIGNHGMIFITPIGNGMFPKFYETIEQAYNHYKPFFTPKTN